MKGIKIACVSLLLLVCACAFAQSEIIGPKCVLPGMSYQYLIKAKWAPDDVVKACITGGKLSDSSLCTPDGKIPSMIFVTWNPNDTLKKIEVTSKSGTISFRVRATRALDAGLIADSDRVQEYKKDKANYTFHCKESKGGGCTPNYLYQWQVSENSLQWKDINGATGKDLQFNGSVVGNTFFRRVTTETNSSTIGFSDQATLMLSF